MLDPHADYVFLGKDATGKRHELSDRITIFRRSCKHRQIF